ncbi:hypothetical protein J3459_020121 [Metarhizium acridum]|nr:hypothetical protein J3459_020121 [Metarhizium acridum]
MVSAGHRLTGHPGVGGLQRSSSLHPESEHLECSFCFVKIEYTRMRNSVRSTIARAFFVDSRVPDSRWPRNLKAAREKKSATRVTSHRRCRNAEDQSLRMS